jgi:hypothetical protein
MKINGSLDTQAATNCDACQVQVEEHKDFLCNDGMLVDLM